MITDWTKIKVNLNFAPRAVKGKRKQTNGYGDIRGKQFVPYGYFAWLTGKSGIYCITCKKNNLKYIGSSKEMRNRIAKHFSNLRTNKHPNRHLQADYNKYGLDGFTITILEETNEDLYSAMDLVIDKLERQFKKYKGKITSKKVKMAVMPEIEDLLEEDEQKIVRRKEVFLKPIDEEEAITQMELLGHTFFVFKNVDTDKINVVYKRNDGDYGIIEAN